MVNTLITKLKATTNDSSLPLYGRIRLKKKIGSNLFRVWGINPSPGDDAEFYSPDGTLKYSTYDAAQTITVNLRNNINRAINFVNETEQAIINDAQLVSGISDCIIVNEMELINAPITILRCNGDFIIGKLPASLTDIQLGSGQTDRGTLSGALSDFKGNNIVRFSSNCYNTNVTGTLASIISKYNPTGFQGVGFDGSLITGELMELKDLLANSTYDSGDISTASLSVSLRNTAVTGSMDDLITYLTGKVFSKKILFSVSNSRITYQGQTISSAIYLTFDENGNPTIS